MAGNMLKRGDSPEKIAEILELPMETIKAWKQESFAVVYNFVERGEYAGSGFYGFARGTLEIYAMANWDN